MAWMRLLREDEVQHLEQCCDACWSRIIPPLESAYQRHYPNLCRELRR